MIFGRAKSVLSKYSFGSSDRWLLPMYTSNSPPGLLMYMCTGILGSSDCKYRSWATIRLEYSSLICTHKPQINIHTVSLLKGKISRAPLINYTSLTGPIRHMILSFRSRENISYALSPLPYRYQVSVYV